MLLRGSRRRAIPEARARGSKAPRDRTRVYSLTRRRGARETLDRRSRLRFLPSPASPRSSHIPRNRRRGVIKGIPEFGPPLETRPHPPTPRPDADPSLPLVPEPHPAADTLTHRATSRARASGVEAGDASSASARPVLASRASSRQTLSRSRERAGCRRSTARRKMTGRRRSARPPPRASPGTTATRPRRRPCPAGPPRRSARAAFPGGRRRVSSSDRRP